MRPRSSSWTRLARLAAEVLEAPIGLVCLVEVARQVFLGAHGLPEELVAVRQTPLPWSVCQHAVASGQPLIVNDTHRVSRPCSPSRGNRLRYRRLRRYTPHSPWRPRAGYGLRHGPGGSRLARRSTQLPGSPRPYRYRGTGRGSSCPPPSPIPLGSTCPQRSSRADQNLVPTPARSAPTSRILVKDQPTRPAMTFTPVATMTTPKK